MINDDDDIYFFAFQTHMESFLQLVCHTLDSFVATFQGEEDDEEEEVATLKDDSDEVQFVMALCGIITSKFDQLEGHKSDFESVVKKVHLLWHLYKTIIIPYL